VQFVERGKFGGHVLGTVAKARGTLRFQPAVARGGKRNVFAVVVKDGLPTGAKTKVGSYVAPDPPKPGAVAALRAVHKKHVLSVSWRGARGATTYVVRLRGSKGTKLALVVKGKGARFTAIRIDEKFTVAVRGVDKAGRTGPEKQAKA
jgi:hypothetical protein